MTIHDSYLFELMSKFHDDHQVMKYTMIIFEFWRKIENWIVFIIVPIVE